VQPGRDVVAAGSAGFVDEMFASQSAQVVAGLADAVVAVIETGEGLHLGGEPGDGEPVRGRSQRQGGPHRVSDPGFVEVHAADAGGTQLGAGGQLIEEAVAEEPGVHAGTAVANRSAMSTNWVLARTLRDSEPLLMAGRALSPRYRGVALSPRVVPAAVGLAR
jgi:hypothetical protein